MKRKMQEGFCICSCDTLSYLLLISVKDFSEQLPSFRSIIFGVEFIVNQLLHPELRTAPGSDWKLSLLQGDLEAYKWNSKDLKFRFKESVMETFPNRSSCSMVS